jgi:murein DD-endopeptidase MepM/ murein hydrolase activator NlpD
VKLILVSQGRGRSHCITLGLWAKALITLCALGLPCSVAALVFLQYSAAGVGFWQGFSQSAWVDAQVERERQARGAHIDAQNKINALAVRVAELQARLVRLDALGERISTNAKLDPEEFDFSQPPALGGPQAEVAGQSYSASELNAMLEQLTAKIDERQHKLESLGDWIADQRITRDAVITGAPVNIGWLSSGFGRRTDPFSGRLEMHEGVDFSGPEGSDVMAVASGLVTYSADKTGYGNLVEINHGNGFKTRYGHCKENLVKVGDVVKKGQVIALLGNTGRSTGPHVHFEVYKNGRVVDPASYIRNTVP